MAHEFVQADFAIDAATPAIGAHFEVAFLRQAFFDVTRPGHGANRIVVAKTRHRIVGFFAVLKRFADYEQR